MKFLNGGSFDLGTLQRRHVHASVVNYIGKEADSFEEVEEFGAEEEHITLYGTPPADRATMISVIEAVPIRQLKVRASVGHAVIARVKAGDTTISVRVVQRLFQCAVALRDELDRADAEVRELCIWLTALADASTVTSLAIRLDEDPSNLRKELKRGSISKALTYKARELRATSEQILR